MGASVAVVEDSGGRVAPGQRTPAIRPAGVRAASPYFRELESLRGAAIALVFVYHVGGFVDGTRGARLGLWVSPLRAFVHAGHTGVSLFFVLSAFLLSIPFLSEAAGGRPVARSRYYARRALRILPLYWAVVFGTSVLRAHALADVLNGVPYLVFLNSVPGFNSALAPYNSVWWSLATEAQFYVLLPLLPRFLGSTRGQWLGCALLIGCAAGYLGYVSGAAHPQSLPAQLALSHSLLGRAPLFAAGIAAAWVYCRHGDRLREAGVRTAWIRNGGADVALLIVLLTLGYLLRAVVFVGYWQMELAWHSWHVVEGLLWALTLLLLLLAPLRLKSVLVNRLLDGLGVLSYSIYLLHVPLLYTALRLLGLTAVAATAPGWTPAVIADVAMFAGVCVVASSVSYRLIERPFLVRKERLG